MHDPHFKSNQIFLNTSEHKFKKTSQQISLTIGGNVYLSVQDKYSIKRTRRIQNIPIFCIDTFWLCDYFILGARMHAVGRGGLKKVG